MWSPIALCITGLSQSGHLTTPNSGRSGSAPKIFIWRASSHCVGGDGGGSEGEDTVGEAGKLSHEKGATETGAGSGLSLSRIVMFVRKVDLVSVPSERLALLLTQWHHLM